MLYRGALQRCSIEVGSTEVLYREVRYRGALQRCATEVRYRGALQSVPRVSACERVPYRTRGDKVGSAEPLSAENERA